MTYQENKPVIVLTDVAQINPATSGKTTAFRSPFQSLLLILILGVFLGFIPSGVNAYLYSAQSRNTYHSELKKK